MHGKNNVKPHPYNKNENADPLQLLFSRYMHLNIDLKFVDFRGDELIDEKNLLFKKWDRERGFYPMPVFRKLG